MNNPIGVEDILIELENINEELLNNIDAITTSSSDEGYGDEGIRVIKAAYESDGYGSSKVANFNSYLEEYYDRPMADFARAQSQAVLAEDGMPVPTRQQVGANTQPIPGRSIVHSVRPPDQRDREHYDSTSPERAILRPRRLVVRRKRKKKPQKTNRNSSSDEFTIDHLIIKSPPEKSMPLD